MRVKAYAKINIGLRVNSKRADGFHEIDSYFAKITLCDDIELKINDSEETSVSIKGNAGYMENGKPDLMERAAFLFSEASAKHFDLQIAIIKRIPVKAGLGGGSSDAASVLLSLNKHYGNILSEEALMSIALSVGSDVPFFLSHYDIAHVRGRGEILMEAKGLSDYFGLLVFMPEHGVSTKNAYSYLDSLNRDDSFLPELGKSVSYSDFPNDFALIEHSLSDALATAFPHSFASLSGSGSAVYMLVEKGGDYEGIYRKAEEYAVRNDLLLYPAQLLSEI